MKFLYEFVCHKSERLHIKWPLKMFVDFEHVVAWQNIYDLSFIFR